MTGVVSTERLLSLSSFAALQLIRTYQADHAELETAELVELIKGVEADAPSLDLEAASTLHETVHPDCPLDGQPFYQACIKEIVVTHQPIWAKSMRQGRIRFTDSLSKDDRDVFAAAGLLESPPSEDVVTWWDDVVGHARLAIEIEKMEQARAAEKLTIDHEINRLQEIGIEREPVWKGLDDNYAGYDVLSYDLEDGKEVRRMIEVKSTVASPLRFILSRPEWKKADEVGEAYLFHVWDMAANPPNLYERTVEQIRPHIPTDNEKGKWSNAAIPIGT